MNKNKFTYSGMFTDEISTTCFNKKLYSKGRALLLGKEELKSLFDFKNFEIRTGFVKYGYYTNFDGEKFNGWHLNFGQTKRKHQTEVEVWVVEAFYD